MVCCVVCCVSACGVLSECIPAVNRVWQQMGAWRGER